MNYLDLMNQNTSGGGSRTKYPDGYCTVRLIESGKTKSRSGNEMFRNTFIVEGMDDFTEEQNEDLQIAKVKVSSTYSIPAGIPFFVKFLVNSGADLSDSPDPAEDTGHKYLCKKAQKLERSAPIYRAKIEWAANNEDSKFNELTVYDLLSGGLNELDAVAEPEKPKTTVVEEEPDLNEVFDKEPDPFDIPF